MRKGIVAEIFFNILDTKMQLLKINHLKITNYDGISNYIRWKIIFNLIKSGWKRENSENIKVKKLLNIFMLP